MDILYKTKTPGWSVAIASRGVCWSSAWATYKVPTKTGCNFFSLSAFFAFFAAILLLAGCSAPRSTLLAHSVQNKVQQTLRDYPRSEDYLRHVTETLEAVAAGVVNPSPEFVRHAVAALPVQSTGQFAARDSREGDITVRQILTWYPAADRAALRQIAAGFRAAIQFR